MKLKKGFPGILWPFRKQSCKSQNIGYHDVKVDKYYFAIAFVILWMIVFLYAVVRYHAHFSDLGLALVQQLHLPLISYFT